MRFAVILLASLSGLLGHASAEERRDDGVGAQHLGEGARVRIRITGAGELTGQVEQLTKDTLLLALEGEPRTVSVPIAALKQIEMSRGARGRARGAWSKAKWGALAGAVPGAIALSFWHEEVGENGSSVGKAAALGAWSGGLLGGLAGAAFGAMSPGESWENVTPTFQIALTSRGGQAFSVGVTLTF